ncbi:hypothetical protein R3P38DRAFT_3116062 [Favolaschia claudopus]|uniref:Uncharacterized protein n=1 Tax=Favolaschia claudopus TaxID=2862362 RepID=A0AAV9ZGZ1_9AGAR
MDEASSEEKSTRRSGAIYNNAELLYSLIEQEIANAVKPYEDTMTILRAKLDSSTELLLSQDTSHIEAELDALKTALEGSGLGFIAANANEPQVLHFVGEYQHLVSYLEGEIKRLSSNPDSLQPISPSTVVPAVVKAFVDVRQRFDYKQKQYSDTSKELDDVKKQLTEQAAAFGTERAHLEESLRAEEQNAASLVNSNVLLSAQVQKLRQCINSNLVEAQDWQSKFRVMEAERDSLKLQLETSEGNLATAHAKSETSRAQCHAAQEELKKTKEDNDKNSRTIQTELDEWTSKCLQVEVELSTTAGDWQKRLDAVEADLDECKAKCVALEKDLESSRESDGKSLAEVDQWKAKHAQAEAGLLAATNEHQVKLNSWDIERNRLKNQAQRNADLITQLQSDRLTLDSQLKDVQAERDSLRDAFQSSTSQAPPQNITVSEQPMQIPPSKSNGIPFPFRSRAPPVSSNPTANVFEGPPSSPPEPIASTSQLPPRSSSTASATPPFPIKSSPPSSSPEPIASTSQLPPRSSSTASATPITSTAPPQNDTASSSASTSTIRGLSGGVPIRRNTADGPSSICSSPDPTSVSARLSIPAKPKPRISTPRPSLILSSPFSDSSDGSSLPTAPNILGSVTSLSRSKSTQSRDPNSNPAAQMPIKHTAASTSSTIASAKNLFIPKKPPANNVPVKRPALSQTNNTPSNPDTQSSLKRPAQTPLVSEKNKISRKDPRLPNKPPPPEASSSTPSFTRPPTVILPPGGNTRRPSGAPPPPITPTATISLSTAGMAPNRANGHQPRPS